MRIADLASRGDAVAGGLARAMRRAGVIVAMIVALWAAVASAEEPPLQAAATPPYAMTGWAGEQGEPPGDVFALAQDTAGFLWLGTPTGLVRFDGSRFIRWTEAGGMELPGGPVHALAADPDGSLWIGYGGGGGVVHIGPRTAIRYSSEQGAPPGVTAMLRDRWGTIWVAGRRGLFKFAGGRWTAIAPGDGYPGGEAISLLEDRAGHVWAGTAAGIFRRAGERFERVSGAAGVQSLAEDASGRLWLTHPNRLVESLDPASRPEPAAGAPDVAPQVRLPAGGWRVLHDGRGQIWIAAFSGLMRIADPTAAVPRVDRVEYEHRLPGSPRALLEDRDGNIWVGMRGGLLRLSPGAFAPVARLEGLNNDGVRTAAVGPDGSVWVATGHAINRFRGSTATAYDIAQTTALHADGRGDVWVATSASLGRLMDGRVEPLPLPAAARPSRVMAITADQQDHVWFCSSLRGASRWDGTHLETFASQAGVARRACQSMYTDRQDRVWIGFLGGGAAVFVNGTFRLFGQEDGLAGGTLLAIVEDRAGAMWFATTDGLSRYSGGRFTTITRAQAPLVDIVPVLVADETGGIWVGVNSGAGLLRIHATELDRVAATPAHPLEFALYDESDGLQKGAQTWQSGVGGVRAADGRLWVATGLGMAIVDPRQLPRQSPTMPPWVETIAVDGRALAPEPGLTLPSGTSTLAVAFGAVSLSSASKLRFRYMLDGVDPEWVYAGSAREATYASLPPGEHRFRVSATSSGTWTLPSVWTFRVAPPFYRTPAFLLILAAGLTMVLVGTWWLRMRAVRHEYALVFAERARVSREIHDTLLQSLAAIGVELETIATGLEPASGPHDALRRLRREIGRAVRDARDSIRELRHNPMQQRTLAEALNDVVAAAGARGPVDFTVEGRERKVDVEVEIQLLRIGQEAVQNAMKHAHASQVNVTLAYEPDRVVLRVADDGCGFAPEDYDPPPPSGEHLGLVTMRERCDRVRGRLTVRSRPGGGTIVEAAMPSQEER